MAGRIKKIILISVSIAVIILPVLFLAGVFYFKVFMPKKKKRQEAVIKIEYGAKAAAVKQDSGDKVFPDPFHSPLQDTEKGGLVEMPASKDLILEGIFYQDGKAAAIINDEIVRIGDFVNQKKIAEIRKKSVVLQDGEYCYILNFKEE